MCASVEEFGGQLRISPTTASTGPLKGKTVYAFLTFSNSRYFKHYRQNKDTAYVYRLPVCNFQIRYGEKNYIISCLWSAE